MVCKAVMYHYVREKNPVLPGLFYLDVDNFKRQLDFFEKEYGFVTSQDWQGVVKNPLNKEVPDGVILTFDDGLIDHYDYVFPILRERGIWAIFYISTATLINKKLLNVHRVHYLLARFGGESVYNKLNNILRDEFFISGFFDNLKSTPYSMQTMDRFSIEVKKIINYALNPVHKDFVLEKIFKKYELQEDVLAKNFYLNNAHIEEMSEYGFLFGAHGFSHNLLTKFNDEEILSEVSDPVDFLNKMLPHESNTFCYPYGGTDSWNEPVLEHLRSRNIDFGFCVESNDICIDDLKNRPLTLPRYDCNQFPFGKSS